MALSAVLVALLFAQRALWPAVLSLFPALLSLLVVFGLLGFSGRPIDLGTSLVGSIVTSSGADFAMHYIWYLLRRPARDVIAHRRAGHLHHRGALGLGMGVLMLGAAPRCACLAAWPAPACFSRRCLPSCWCQRSCRCPLP